MKQSSNSLFWGAVLLGFGLLFLAKAMGWFHIEWGETLRFWPLLLILAGLSLVARQSWSAVVAAILIAFAIPAAIMNKGYKKLTELEEEGIEFNLKKDYGDHEETYDNDNEGTSTRGDKAQFTEPFIKGTQEAMLDFGAGAGRFNIGGTTSDLIDADTKTDFGNYVFSNKRNESEKRNTIVLKMEGKDSTKVKLRDFDGDRNKVDIQLNANPVWSFDIGLGAGKGKFDLSDYKVKKVKIGAGAADIKLKLGEQIQNNAEIEIDAGVASIDIDIPESVGCELYIDGALNSKDFDNFEKINEGLYRTSNYGSATKKIKIAYEGGFSKIEVNRY